MTDRKRYQVASALSAVLFLSGCYRPEPGYPDTHATEAAYEDPYDTVIRATASERGISTEAAKAALDADMERERRAASARQNSRELNWVNIGISTGKFSESIGASVYKTYEECADRSSMEDNECFPIAALPASYWAAEEVK